MNKLIRPCLAIAVAVALLPALPAHADQIVMNTGAPAADAGNYVFNSSQFFADEFHISAGETVTQLGAYLLAGSGSGTAFTFDIYAAGSSFDGGSNTVNRLNSNGYLVQSFSATFTGNGWNTQNVSWTPTQSGDYWLAIEAANPTSLLVPTVNGQPNATAGAGALAFDVAGGGGGKFSATSAAEAGIEISAVPLPAAAWLMLSGLGGLATLVRKKRAV